MSDVAGFAALGKCQVMWMTAKAVLIQVLATGDRAWMPKACVEFGFSLECGEVFEGFVDDKMWLRKMEELYGRQQAQKAARARAPVVVRVCQPRTKHWVPPRLPRLRSITT